jgi:VWFA-related protein
MKAVIHHKSTKGTKQNFGFLFCAFCAFVVFVVNFPARAAAQTPPPAASETLRIGTEEVMLDVIVRDKKGRPVRDLRPEEIEVYEDGARQTIASFRLVEVAGGPLDPDAKPNPAANTPRQPGFDPARQINLVTMVFDNLDANGRKLARDAALDFLNYGLRDNVLVSVFVVDNRFYLLQPFTGNRDKLKTAIEAATGRAEKPYADTSRQMVEQIEIIANAPDFGPPAGTPGQAAPPTQAPTGMQSLGQTPTGMGAGASATDKMIAQITLSTLRAIESAQLDQRARASIYAFMHIARQQRAMAGRKSVLYFSNGLQVPANLSDALRTTISEANRANVSIYAMDARGLGMEIESERARREMALAIKASRDSVSLNGAMDRSAMMSADFAESSVRMNKQGTLAELAEGTGGFLAANTNDLRAPLRRVAAELASYYAVAYLPRARELDGKFRAVTVKTSRRDLAVQTRNGYFAVPAVDGKPVMAYEMPMLAAAANANPPRDFAHQAAAPRFAPGTSGDAQFLLLVEAPLAEMTFTTDKAKKEYSTHLAVMALIRNEAGAVVHRVARDYPIAGRLERLEGLRKGNLDFSQSFRLTPGRYTLETIVHDFGSGRTSVERQPLVVPDTGAELAAGSLGIVKRLERGMMEMPKEDKPLVFPQGRIVPFLGDTVRADLVEYVSFFFNIYIPAGGPDGRQEPPTMTIEYLRDGQVLSRGEMPLPAPDERGRVAQVWSAPAKAFPPGRYEARAIVTRGMARVEERAAFIIQNPSYVQTAGKPVLKAEAETAAPEPAPAEAAPAAPPPSPIAPTGVNETARAASQAIAGAAAAEFRAAPVDVAALLREVTANGRAMHRHMLDFTYQHRKLLHHLDEAGRVIKEEYGDYEAYPVLGRHVLVKVANNGKPLPDWEVEQERRRAGEELGRVEQLPSRADGSVASEVGYVTAFVNASIQGKSAGILIDPGVFLRACEFFDPRYEQLAGREMFALDFLPMRGADLANVTSYVARLQGTIWIDAADKVIVRIEARNLLPGIGKNGKPLPQARAPKLVYQQMRLANGDWFPQLIRLNAAGDGSAFYGLNLDAIFEFKNFQQFNTSGETTKILAPEKKP